MFRFLSRMRRFWWRFLLLAALLVLASSALLLVRQSQDNRSALMLTPTASATALPTTLATPTPGMLNPIAAENALPGTTAWQMADPAYSAAIQAYADAASVSPGGLLTFYVSTAQAGTPYTVQIFRLGWYGGLGGRLLLTLRGTGQAQGVYIPTTQKLVGCKSCSYHADTHLIEANWQPSFSFVVPASWVTGLYEVKLVDANNQQAVVSFTVRGSLHSAYVAVMADNTTQAYNKWGGYNLYYGPGHNPNTRASMVSFDRPTLDWYDGLGNSLAYEIDALRFLERNGYDVSYLSSVDLQTYPSQLLFHRAFISIGHDEYWSKTMRDGLENARNHGVSLAFLSGNDLYWQVRYLPDDLGRPNRTLVCYKSLADPLVGRDNARVTVRWRDWPLLRPENALMGAMFSGNSADALKVFPWHTGSASSWLAGTGLQPGHNYGCNLVGSEWDSVTNNGETPRGLVVLGASPVRSGLGIRQISNTTIYRASSGAYVFDAGSINWTVALDDFHLWTVATAGKNACFAASRVIPGMQMLLARVLAAMIGE